MAKTQPFSFKTTYAPVSNRAGSRSPDLFKAIMADLVPSCKCDLIKTYQPAIQELCRVMTLPARNQAS